MKEKVKKNVVRHFRQKIYVVAQCLSFFKAYLVLKNIPQVSFWFVSHGESFIFCHDKTRRCSISQEGSISSCDCTVWFDEGWLQFWHLLHGWIFDTVILGYIFASCDIIILVLTVNICFINIDREIENCLKITNGFLKHNRDFLPWPNQAFFRRFADNAKISFFAVSTLDIGRLGVISLETSAHAQKCTRML